ncbi:TonB-dependent receptor [Dysgonomonas termitidis]|uniref:TonB-dependent receptor n=1 Tax=Dysgonomonas termitidis TaxID=1516126 RepID=A0ABV9L3N9_9BACT
MKKIRERDYNVPLLRKILLIMKITTLLLILAVCNIAASTYGQSGKISMKKTSSIWDILKDLENNSDFTFFFNDNQVDRNKKVSVNVKNTTVENTLEQIFQNTEYTYQVVGQQILIKVKNESIEEVVQQKDKIVTGVIKDNQGTPVAGASVVVKGTTVGTVTDADGNFSLKVPDNAILTISFIGFKPSEILIKDAAPLSVTLEEDMGLLDEVIVIGYGGVKKNDATGAVLAIKPDQLNKGSQISAQDALIGKIPGVYIIPGSGAPGDGGTIRIRSGSSLSASNDPLIVIDGVPIDNSSIQGSSNIMSVINPNDIASFTVLKDASSTAIYGSRASNGVIIITTKKGAAGSSVKLNYNNHFTVGTATKKIDVLNADEFRAFVAEHNASSPSVVAGLGTDNTDWQDEIYRTSFGHEHNLSATGSLKDTPYRISLGYTNQQGIIKTNNYERFTGGFGLSPSFFNKHLTVNLNVKGSYEKNRDIDSSVVPGAVFFDPTRPVHVNNSDYGLGYFIWLSSGGKPLGPVGLNPVSILDLRNSVAKIKRSIGNAAIDYKVHGLEDLRFNLNLGYDVLKSDGRELIPDNAPKTYVTIKLDGQGQDRTYIQKKRNYLIDFYGNYNKELGIHHIDVMGGYGWQHFWTKFNEENLNHKGEELFPPTHSESEYYLLSFYGRLNYSIASKYLFTATLRADASSRFSKDNRWGYFPSAAFAWRIDQEDFMKDVRALSDLKLRLSYGQTGQQDIGSDYPYMSTYTASYDNVRYMFGDRWYTTYRADGYDPDIKWESTETYNAGIDFGFFKGRINGSIDVYYRKTKDLLNRILVAAGSNLSTEIYTNIGSMKNAGFEFALNTVPVSTKDLNWDFNVNLTYNKSEITKLNMIDSDTYVVKVGAVSSGKEVQIHAVGYAPYTFYLAQQAYDEDGNALDGKYIQADGSISSDDTYRRKAKSPNPRVYMGLSSKVTYKNWDLGFNAHASFGNYIYNHLVADDYKGRVYDLSAYKNILRVTRDKGFEVQRLYSDYFLENGSFFKMDNITAGYTFPKLGKSDMSLRLSGAVQNVFIITGYSGLDPEIYSGIDRNTYPRPRVYTLSLNLNF